MSSLLEGNDEAVTPVGVTAEIDWDAVGPIQVSIARTDRPHAKLLFDPALWGDDLSITDADHTVVFDVCDGPATQYRGGFVVDGARCVTVRVTDAGAGAEPVAGHTPFGVDRNACG